MRESDVNSSRKDKDTTRKPRFPENARWELHCSYFTLVFFSELWTTLSCGECVQQVGERRGDEHDLNRTVMWGDYDTRLSVFLELKYPRQNVYCD